MSSLDASLKPSLDSRRIRNILREVPDSIVLIRRPPQADFSSNDYLSLSTSPKLKQSFINKIKSFPRVLGSGGSRLLDGGTLEHALLEERLAAFFESPAALLYTSGYDANVGFFGSVPLEGDMVIYDSLIHASVHDGMRISRASRIPGSLQPFEHNSIVSLRSVIQLAVSNRPGLRRGIGNVLIAVESLYSMDGDIAPMAEICDLVDELLPCKNGHLVVDEAHATGIYGSNGRGLVSFFGLEDRVTARLHTFGKALASSGAVFLTSKIVRSYLINYSRPQVFTTAMTHANVANLHAVFDVLESGECAFRSAQLRDLSHHFVQEFSSRSFPPELVRLPWAEMVLYTPIIPLLSPFARPLALYLQQRGFLVRPITHPTVPKGQDRVRSYQEIVTTSGVRAESKSRIGIRLNWAPSTFTLPLTFLQMLWNPLRRQFKSFHVAAYSVRAINLTQNPCRYRFASTRAPANSSESKTKTSEVLPPKPKANTSLRKAASASLSIREKPTATRGAIRPVFTISTAERYILQPLVNVLKPSNATMLAEALWLPVVPPRLAPFTTVNRQENHGEGIDDEHGFGEAFVFENGCAVFWGVQEEDARLLLDNLVRKNGVEIGRYSEEETEEVEFVTDPTERTRLQGDLIILGEPLPLSSPEELFPSVIPPSALPEDTLAARYAFSEALARSTALSATETGVEEFLSSVSKLPHTLSSTGKPGLNRTEIIKKMGLLLKFRQRIFLNPQNFTDMPEIYWSEPVLEKYFTEMSDALEIKSRTQLVNAKITYAVELQSVMRELLTEASGHRMELIIIALIAFEATLAFIREGPEIWRMITGEPTRRHENAH